MKRSGWILILYLFASLALFFYSFTQVDANMTISRFGLLQVVQGKFQWVGMSQRPLSTGLYLSILAMLFILYTLVVREAKRGEVSERGLWKIVFILTGVLVFSYPAFSYDLFNYMFTAKTVLVYRQNPYDVIPLQFAGIDPWTNFMRWTHLPSAYTPFWIVLTLPTYLLGFGHLLTTLWSTKLLVGLFHIATIVGIGKILEKVEPKFKVLGMAIFALNPLIIIEDLVSAHNDVVMTALAIWAIVFLLQRKKLTSWFLLSLSVAAKLITAAIIPVWFFVQRKGTNPSAWLRTSWRNWMLIFMIGGVLAVIATREVLPWYWVWIVPFVALVPTSGKLTTLSTGISLGLLLRYAPYLYHGHYDPPVRLWRDVLTWVPILVATVAVVVAKRRPK